MKHIILILSLLIASECVLTAQQDIKYTRRGNKQYEKGNFSEADVQYKKALEKNPQNTKASFNLGASQYRQENWEDATTSFTGSALNFENDTPTKAESFYNLGNTLMKQQKYQESIEAYKQSLRLNPKDEDARYNLAYAKQKLEQQKQEQNNQNQDQNKDQQQDQQQQQQEDQQQQDQQQDQQQQQNQQQQDQQQQKEQRQQEQQISKEDAEKMLEAMKNKEQNTMEKVKEQKVGKGKKMDKDW